jgi:hypothetical protein
MGTMVARENVAQPKPSEKPALPRMLPAQSSAWKLSAENLQALNQIVQELKLKGYSLSTIANVCKPTTKCVL